MTALNITAEELFQARTFASQGNLANAWKILADRGDAYAYLAQYIIMPNPKADSLLGTGVAKLFHEMVRLQWLNTTGTDLAGSPIFIEVGKRYLNNYVSLLEAAFTKQPPAKAGGFK